MVIKKYQYSKNRDKGDDDKANILNCDFETDTISKKLVTDITYIHAENAGWIYSASVMDLYDRKMIGWSAQKEGQRPSCDYYHNGDCKS